MSNKPIFVATHPRACSTAFERVFMTRRDILTCVHEPFGDAFYFGPERLSPRYEDDDKAREESGFSSSTYKTIFERIEQEGKEVRLSSTSSLCAAPTYPEPVSRRPNPVDIHDCAWPWASVLARFVEVSTKHNRARYSRTVIPLYNHSWTIGLPFSLASNQTVSSLVCCGFAARPSRITISCS